TSVTSAHASSSSVRWRRVHARYGPTSHAAISVFVHSPLRAPSRSSSAAPRHAIATSRSEAPIRGTFDDGGGTDDALMVRQLLDLDAQTYPMRRETGRL